MTVIKQTLTPTKAQKVAISLQRLAIISNVLLFESMNQLDADFRMPQVNNWAKRIKEYSESIDRHLFNTGWYDKKHTETAQEYSAEIWRSIDMLCGIDIEAVKEFNDDLSKELV